MFVITDNQMRAFTDHFKAKFMTKALHYYDEIYKGNKLEEKEKLSQIEAHVSFGQKINMRKEKSVLQLIKCFADLNFSDYAKFTDVEKKIISFQASDESTRLAFLQETIVDYIKNKKTCQELEKQ